jgi:radical SAM family uncharacterized protein/radical SAM-linked protein
MSLKATITNEILPLVEKPSRYLGTELNTVHKDAASVEVRLALVFPDLYDLGLGNLGLHILYAILNRLPWCWAERGYAPGPDLEDILRARDLPLFVNESKDPLGNMDGIGFTLQSELTYTSILNILDLAKLPLRAEHRDEGHPLVFAGGPAAFNPEPLAPFMDFFVIGDGEEVVVEIAQVLRETRGAPRAEKLARLAQLQGVYVPALYPFEQLADGRILPKEDAPKIVKRLVRDLNNAEFPTDYIVPFTHLIHDRVGLEVLRGCTQGCRFCQAGMTSRPVRERTIENITDLMEKTLDKTGYEEVSLVSLSTCDYSTVRTMVQRTAQLAEQRNVSVSLPSLRLDSFSVELADMVSGQRRSGLTFAPEAASPRLRAVINKWIPDEELLNMAAEAFRLGWQHVKCYFMIGLPTERDEDVEAIVDLCLRTLRVGRGISSKARVFTGVSTFVPKPFTPFQWARQIDIDETERRQDILQSAFRGNGGIKFGRHEAGATFIEGLITRADRRAADLIEAAFRNGARLESDSNHFRLDAWIKAIEETGYDVEAQLRERSLDERLPWDHIDILIEKQWLKDEWQRASELKHAEDCRQSRCHKCGVIDRERELCQHMLLLSKRGAKQEKDWERQPRVALPEPPAVQRLRFRIGRSEEARLLSHLELVNAWIRALRRADAPVSYSQGFHAHPKVTFSTAAPVGEESRGDYMDVILRRAVDPQVLLAALQERLPLGFHVYTAQEVPLHTVSLMEAATGFVYTLHAEVDSSTLSRRVSEILGASEAVIERRKKPTGGRPSTKSVNVRPSIAELVIEEGSNGTTCLRLTARTVDNVLVKPREVIGLLGLEPEAVRVVKHDTLFAGS